MVRDHKNDKKNYKFRKKTTSYIRDYKNHKKYYKFRKRLQVTCKRLQK